MLYKRTGYPEEDEITLCKVTRVQYNTVFVSLLEYDTGGIIHISEISPGRIRNIRDYVKEGKVIVCKVLRVNQEKGHIDLSLRRVNKGQQRNKVNQIKQEQKAEKIVEFVAKNLGQEPGILYNEVFSKVSAKYEYLHSCFNDVVQDDSILHGLGIPEKTAKALTETIKSRIKPPEVKICGVLTLKSYQPDGVEIIKKSFTAVKNDCISFGYMGGGRYSLCITSKDYKTAESLLDDSIKAITGHIESNQSIAQFQRS
ncbi:MAG: S1 RNA-binding domain-containing protein [archaeon]